MKINRPILLIIILVGFGLSSAFGGIQSHNSSVNSSPYSIISAIIMGVFAIFLPRKDYQDRRKVPIGLWRRFFASYIDFMVVIALLIGIGIIPILIIEYFATGNWEWSYERASWKSRDMFGFVMIFSIFFGLFYYFYTHAKLGKPTPGQYVMGYRIVPADYGKPDFTGRTFHGFTAFCLSIFTLMIYGGVKNGVYPWDQKSNTRAVAITT